MELIEKLNLTDFHAYLRATDNTICGRYPISLLLAVGLVWSVLSVDSLPVFRSLDDRTGKENDSIS